MTQQKGDIPLETRLILVERDVELLKLRDGDIRSWQESVNRTSYKIESLEKSLDDTRERFDEIKGIFKDTINGQREMQDILLKKIEHLAKPPSSDEKPNTSWKGTIDTLVKIIFIILIIAAGFLGVKIPGGIQ